MRQESTIDAGMLEQRGPSRGAERGITSRSRRGRFRRQGVGPDPSYDRANRDVRTFSDLPAQSRVRGDFVTNDSRVLCRHPGRVVAESIEALRLELCGANPGDQREGESVPRQSPSS